MSEDRVRAPWAVLANHSTRHVVLRFDNDKSGFEAACSIKVALEISRDILLAATSLMPVAPRVAPRDDRQAVIAAWSARAFGAEQATSLPQRALRLLEEALEAYQAAGGDRVQAHALVDFVLDRPVGQIGQELGGIGVCLLALAAAAGLSAEGEEAREVARVLAKPIEHFTQRNAAKNAAGFLAPDLATEKK
jgi:hypothetical protein